MSLSVVIPTLGREKVLLETVGALLALEDAADGILVVDQTPTHEPETDRALGGWSREGHIRWIRLARPSIPVAMNTGLREAESDVVLFLDDDVVPDAGLVRAHRRAHEDPEVSGVAGMVLQPGEQPDGARSAAPPATGLRRDLDFRFTGRTRCEVWNVMAGNLSVKKQKALACGGFDEQFVGVAYRFETEFCRRLRRSGGKVVYEPAAVLHHLRAPSGGTRTYGSHLTSARGEHSVGDYYFALLEGRGAETWTYAARRLLTECFSRFHRSHPWYIPSKAMGELRGLRLALRLSRGRAGTP